MAFEADSTTPPTIVNSSVGRTWEYLTGAEDEKLMAAARKSSRLTDMVFGPPKSAICNGTRSSSMDRAPARPPKQARHP